MADRGSSTSVGAMRGRARGRARTTPGSVPEPMRTHPTYESEGDSASVGAVSDNPTASEAGEAVSVSTESCSSLTKSSLCSSLQAEGGSTLGTTSAKSAKEGSGSGAGSGSGDSGDKSKGIRTTIRPTFNKVGTQGESFNVMTNYLHMNKTPGFQLYQYRVDFKPDEADTFRKKLLMRSKESEVGSYIFDGHMLYTTKPIPMEKRELTIPDKSKEGVAFTVYIKTVGNVLPDSPMYVQFYNMVMRKCMAHLEMEELGRHFYDRANKIELPEEKLELWPGLVTAIRNHQVGMLLCVEITHKVLRMAPVLETIAQIKARTRSPEEFMDEVKKELIGTIVMTHYNRRTYKVDDIDFATTPNSTFEAKDGTNKRYADYFLERWNIEVKNINQPMLVSYPKEKDKNKGETGNILLVPSLCNPTGLTDNMRKDYKLMKKLSEHLHMGPNQRKIKLDEFVRKIKESAPVQQEFKNWDIDFHPAYIMADARKHPSEKIFMGPVDSDPTFGDVNADWTRQLKGRGMLYPKEFNNWILFVPSRDQQGADLLIETLRIEGRRLNVNVSQPVAVIQIQDNRRMAMTIRQELQKRGDSVKFAIGILPNNNLKGYADFKKVCTLDFGIGSQGFLAKHIKPADPRAKAKLGSICVKVIIQITAKLGGVPWGVKIPVKKLMVLGFDVYHCSERKNESVGALVSTTDQSLNKYFSSVGFHKDKSELAHNLATGMQKSLQAFMLENDGALPDRVILFRDGVGEGQINYVLDYEIPRLREGLDDMYARNNQEKARLAVVIVTKKINSRALLEKSGLRTTYDNVGPGTVIDNTITLPERYDYFLVSQSVNQGTVSPTNYNVVYDESEFTPDHMQKLSFKLCHLYYNWCGTVAVPAPCQYAHKLAYLTGVSLNAEAPQGLANCLWYL